MSDFPYQMDPFVNGDPILTVRDAQNTLRESSGVVHNKNASACPCCNQLVMVYRRLLNSSMARSLIWITLRYEANPAWIHVPTAGPKWQANSREYPKLAWWKMLESKPNLTDPSKRCSGWWKPTLSGIEFAYGRLRVASHAYVYNGGVLDYDGTERITIEQALSEDFDYAKLMRGGHADTPADDADDTDDTDNDTDDQTP